MEEHSMNGIITFLAVLAISGTVLAQGNVDIASIDKNSRQEVRRQAAHPVVTEKYEYYDIAGSNEKEMRLQMSKNGTKWDDGKVYNALTTWNVKWDYDYNCTAKGCTPDLFKARVAITFRYPRWNRPAGAPEPLATKWETYMANLIFHENGHRDMAVEQTAALAAAVEQLPPAPSRAELDRRIETLVNDRMAKMNADEKEYDVVTIHGATQGAVFP